MRRAGPLLVMLLAACGSRPQPIVLRPTAPEPPPGIDGRYRGTARLVRSESRFCPRSGPRVYEVVRGMVTFAYSTSPGPGQRPDRVPLTADVQPDGRIQASDGVGMLDGQLHDGVLEVTVASQECEHRWTMRKVS